MQLILVILFIVIFPESSHSQNLGMSLGANNQLILSGRSCADLLKQEKALCQWKKKEEPDFVIPKESSKCASRDPKNSVILSRCLPVFAKTYQGKRLTRDGPNCWGTAMSFKKLSNKPRFMWSEEMTYWMESPICRKLNPGEKKEPGDIINVYSPEYISTEEVSDQNEGTRFWEALYPGRVLKSEAEGYSGYHALLHSVTYVTDDLAFGKDSPSKSDRFYFHPMEEVYGRPRKHEKSCQENQNLSAHLREYENKPKDIKRESCAYFSTIHRCENFSDYFSESVLSGENKEIWDNINALKEVQDKLFPLILSMNSVVSKTEIELVLNMSDIEVSRVRQELSRPGLDKTKEMLLTLEYFTAAGLRKSLEFGNVVP